VCCPEVTKPSFLESLYGFDDVDSAVDTERDETAEASDSNHAEGYPDWVTIASAIGIPAPSYEEEGGELILQIPRDRIDYVAATDTHYLVTRSKDGTKYVRDLIDSEFATELAEVFGVAICRRETLTLDEYLFDLSGQIGAHKMDEFEAEFDGIELPDEITDVPALSSEELTEDIPPWVIDYNASVFQEGDLKGLDDMTFFYPTDRIEHIAPMGLFFLVNVDPETGAFTRNPFSEEAVQALREIYPMPYAEITKVPLDLYQQIQDMLQHPDYLNSLPHLEFGDDDTGDLNE
jgi:hypothetical protein